MTRRIKLRIKTRQLVTKLADRLVAAIRRRVAYHIRTEFLWAIVSKEVGLYPGTYVSRQDAVYKHCKFISCVPFPVSEDRLKALWKHRQSLGDRVALVEVAYKLPKGEENDE